MGVPRQFTPQITEVAQISYTDPLMERETLDFDVVFVGAGPANLSGALHLAQLVKQSDLGDIEIAVIEKGASVGAHILSGAVMDPRAAQKILPDILETSAAPP